ncbi:hypothetical protein H310_04659 [Aphanomyces invadans]|uniref:FYVE-type domain-containing protein n=1 Tax=Aphanomyces invadans TaxID=157072 RepID=A0A024UDT7_9STRA|nr:hypothetical protein H310_04659 [Aphanomyces invadans]ETW04370.1 hypothetical protein H310_04659 [Aphanomyces invadans]|eukprot:XP_008867326.1 hypothetical protein H310_04659 [Aphanomyces invadans]
MASMIKKSEVIRLAEGCRWPELRALIEKDPKAAQERDRFGMIPLHWACTDPNTPQDLLMLLLKAYPAGARVLNSGKMLPLHIAIKAQASIEWLQALLANYPDAAIALTPTNEDVVTLAKKYRLPPISINLLEEMRDHVQKSGHRPGSHTTDEEAEDFDDIHRNDSILITTTRFDKARSHSTSSSARPNDSFSSEHLQTLHTSPPELDDPATSSQAIYASTVPLPPRWTNALNCHICASKFGTFKKRHHCRNCGQSICTDHSAKHKLKLPHFGLMTRQRVCVRCHDILTNAPAAALLPPQLIPGEPSTTASGSLSSISTSSIKLFTSQRGVYAPIGSSRAQHPVPMSQPPYPLYAFQPAQEQLVPSSQQPSLRGMNYGHQLAPFAEPSKDSVIQDMNLQVQLLQQQVSKLLEEKQQVEDALLITRRQTAGRSSSTADEVAQVQSAAHDIPQPEPEQCRAVHADYFRPSWEEAAPVVSTTAEPSAEEELRPVGGAAVSGFRETSLTDHDVARDTYACNTYDDIGEFRDSRFTLDDRDTFFDKYVAPVATRQPALLAPSSSQLEEVSEADESDVGRTTIADDSEVQQYEQQHTEKDGNISPEDEHDDDNQEVDTLLALGVDMLQQGCASGAVAAFERAVELMPKDPLLHSYLGKACYADEDVDRAISAIERSLELEPSAANWTLLGKILFEKGDHDKAIEAYQRSLEMQKRVG